MWSTSYSYAQLIKASAGSGKTFQLTARMIALLLLGEDPSAILATTFTRKAAGEILSRLFSELARATIDKSQKHSLINSLESLDLLQSNSVSHEAPDNALLRLIAKQHKLNVCTLDSFVFMVAQLYHLEGGLVEVPKIIGSDEEEEITLKALNKLIEIESPQAICKTLYLIEGQTKSSSVLRPLRSLGEVLRDAHAGADNTLWHETDAKITGPTLSREDLRELITNFLAGPVPITTKGGPDTNWTKACALFSKKILLDDWQDALGGSIIQALKNKGSFYRKEAPQALIEAASPIIDYATEMLRAELYRRGQAFVNIARKYSQIFTEMRAEKSLFSFDELTNHLASNLSSESLHTVFFRLDTVYRHLMLDEFQDTALTQWRLIAPLAEEILSSLSQERTFFCVGDTKQAIYGWRGGVSWLFSHLEENYKNVLKTKPLNVCFRCSPALLSFTDKLFCNLSTAQSMSSILKHAQPWLDKYSPHTSAKSQQLTDEDQGFVAVCTLSDTFLTKSLDDDDEKSNDALGLFTVNSIKTILSINDTDAIPSIGVLTRTNDTAQYLQSYIKTVKDTEPYLTDKINVGSEAGAVLADLPPVKSLLSFLHFLDHPHDSISRFHLANSAMNIVVGTTDFKDDIAFENLYKNIRHEWTERGLANALRRRLTELFKNLDHTEYLALNASLLIIENIEKRNFGLRTKPFQLAIQRAASEGIDSTQVRIMTIHKSKGLEFDYVILPELNVPLINFKSKTGPIIIERDPKTFFPLRIFPKIPKDLEWLFPEVPSVEIREQQELRAIEDSLSLLYVSLTRARRGLFILDLEHNDKASSKKVTYQSVIRDIFANNMPHTERNRGFVELRYLEGKLNAQPLLNEQINCESVQRNCESPSQPAKVPSQENYQPKKYTFDFKQNEYLPHRAINLHLKSKFKNKNFLSELSLLKSYENALRTIDWFGSDNLNRCTDFSKDLKDSAATKVSDWLGRPEVQLVLNYNQCKSNFFESSEATLALQKNKRFLIKQSDCFLSGVFLRLVYGSIENNNTSVLLVTFDNDESNLKKYRQILSIMSGFDEKFVFSYSLPW